MTLNFMPEKRTPEHLAGLEGFIRSHIVDPDDLVYALSRHRYIRMVVGCVIETTDDSDDFLPFLFSLASSMNALTFFYDRLYDFSGETLASARDGE